MKSVITPTQRRMFAIAIAVLAMIALIAAIAVPALLLHQRYDKFIDEYSDRLLRYRRVAAQRAAIDQAIKTTESLDGRANYLRGSSATLAAAELQGMVTRIVEAHEGKVISSQVILPKDDAKTTGPSRVAIATQMGASMVPLQLILHAIETNTPHLFIDQLTVRANQGRGYKPIPGMQTEFAVQLTVHAHLLASEKKP